MSSVLKKQSVYNKGLFLSSIFRESKRAEIVININYRDSRRIGLYNICRSVEVDVKIQAEFFHKIFNITPQKTSTEVFIATEVATTRKVI